MRKIILNFLRNMDILFWCVIILFLTFFFFYLPYFIDGKYFKERKTFLYLFVWVANALFLWLFYIASSVLFYNFYIFLLQCFSLILIYILILWKEKSKKLIFLMIPIFLLSPAWFLFWQKSYWQDFQWVATNEYHYKCIWLEFRWLFESKCIWKVTK